MTFCCLFPFISSWPPVHFSWSLRSFIHYFLCSRDEWYWLMFDAQKSEKNTVINTLSVDHYFDELTFFHRVFYWVSFLPVLRFVCIKDDRLLSTQVQVCKKTATTLINRKIFVVAPDEKPLLGQRNSRLYSWRFPCRLQVNSIQHNEMIFEIRENHLTTCVFFFEKKKSKYFFAAWNWKFAAWKWKFAAWNWRFRK